MKKLALAGILLFYTQLQLAAFGQDVQLSGFVDARYGIRTQSDPNSDQETAHELRLQLEGLWYHDLFTLTTRADFLYDAVTNEHDHIRWQRGEGPVDLRELNVLFSPNSTMDVKVGRQILTWGTGDLLFINDLFPKDWKSFFAGRDEEYLKAPSDALFMSFFPAFANVDIAYTPRFNADRFISGERFSYWGGTNLTGADLPVDRPGNWCDDDEISARIYRTVNSIQLAAYFYHGFWKTPQGFDPASQKNTFPKLTVYGASARGSLAGGIANIEAGYYDSRQDRGGDDPFIPNSQIRLLAGYEHELAKNLTGAVQYYIEHTLKHNDYRDAFNGPAGTEADQNRHVITLRLTQMLLNQNLTLGLFTYWSPSDHDGYLRPSATYKLSDNWLLEARGNFFFGKNNHTFFGQFQDNNNIALAARYSF